MQVYHVCNPGAKDSMIEGEDLYELCAINFQKCSISYENDENETFDVVRSTDMNVVLADLANFCKTYNTIYQQHLDERNLIICQETNQKITNLHEKFSFTATLDIISYMQNCTYDSETNELELKL